MFNSYGMSVELSLKSNRMFGKRKIVTIPVLCLTSRARHRICYWENLQQLDLANLSLPHFFILNSGEFIRISEGVEEVLPTCFGNNLIRGRTGMSRNVRYE